MFNNRGQIASTITWMVATIIVIVVLIISISVVSLNLKNKEFTTQGYSDLLVTKSLSGYLLTDNLDVWNKIKDKKVLPPEEAKIDKQLVKNIFLEQYNQKYNSNQILLRMNSEWCGWGKGGCGTSASEIVLFNLGGLPPNQKIDNLFYENLKIKNFGDKDQNSILELMLN